GGGQAGSAALWVASGRGSAAAVFRARSMAQKTASGVAGRASVTSAGPAAAPAPVAKAATASRSASRTLIASIKGGSPTALLPWTTPGSRARASSVTRRSGGHSPRLGSLYVEAPAVASAPSAVQTSSSVVSQPTP